MEEKHQRMIAFEMKCVNNMIRRKLDIRFQEAGLGELTGMQAPMLGYINSKLGKQDVFQRDLEKEFNIRRSTATVMLQTLEQKGYIVREPVDSDGRLKRIVLTDKAIAHNRAIRRQIDAFNKELAEEISKEEQEAFFRVIDKIKSNLE